MKNDQIVKLVNKGDKTFVSKWDGKEVKIPKGKHIEVVYGLAKHFQKQDENLVVEEIQPEEVKPRKVKNPLETNERGEPFPELG